MTSLLLTDLTGLAHRAVHGAKRRNGMGIEPGRLVFRWVAEAIHETQATHGALCCDVPGPTWHHEVLPAYKSKRGPETPEDAELRRQVRVAEDLARALAEDMLGLRSFALAGFEADDLIGTLVHHTEPYVIAAGGRITVQARDKDLLQLVSGTTSVRDFQDKELYDSAQVLKKYKVLPRQMVDYLALVGDSTDGYPGCPGVGPVAAVDLLLKFGALKGFFALAPEGEVAIAAGPAIPQKLREKLRAGAQSIERSRRLAQLRTDAPLEIGTMAGLALADREAAELFIR